jgi:GGDEF domain-containing protein
MSKGQIVPITASIGLGIYPNSLTPNDLNNSISELGEILFQNTDAALYKAKNSGRNKVCIA